VFVGDVWGAGDEVASLTVPPSAETDLDASAGERRARAERFPGKRVVAGCFIVLMVSSGLGFYGLAVYLNAFSRERGWAVTSISLATTVYFVVGGVTGLFVARLIARYDVRVPIVGGAIAGGASLAVLGRVEQRWQLYVVYIVFALGFSGAGLIPVTTVVTRWYHARRSVALSIASTGLSAGGIVLTPFAKWLIDRHGLASATPILGLIWVVGILPFALWLVRPDPARLGWRPDGERVTRHSEVVVPMGTPFAEAIRTRFFATATIAYGLVLGSQVGGIQQLVKLVEVRIDRGTAALATTALAGMSVIARLAGGRIVSRLPIVGMVSVLACGQAAALVAMAFASTTATLFPAIILFGATVGNILMLQPLVIAERFGVLDYPRIFSRTIFLTMFGTAGGPLLLGWLYDNAGGFRTSYLTAAAGSVTGAFVLASGGPAGARYA
jgi:MFS family permease